MRILSQDIGPPSPGLNLVPSSAALSYTCLYYIDVHCLCDCNSILSHLRLVYILKLCYRNPLIC
jgi:hypothetical protein